MAGDPKNPEVWELSVDASELKPFLVERTDTRQGLLIERDGFAVVDGEIRSNQPVYGDQAGITAGDFTKYTTTCDHIAACDRFLPVLQRMLNNVVRTRADAVDKRERLINSFAKSCDERAKVHEDDSLRV